MNDTKNTQQVFYEYIEVDKYAFIETIPELYSRLFYFHKSMIDNPFMGFFKLLRVPLVQGGLLGLFIKTYKKQKKKRRGNLWE